MEKKETVIIFFVSTVICALLCAFVPAFGIFSAVALPAIYGVCVAASSNIAVVLSPAAGIALAWLLWGDVAVAVTCLLFLIPGIFLGVCLRKRATATATVVTVSAVYAGIFSAVFLIFALSAFGSVGRAIEELLAFVTSYMEEAFRIMAENDPSGEIEAIISQFPMDQYASLTVMLLPGTFIAACEVLGYILSHAGRLAIRILPVPQELYPEERSIKLPVSAAVLFIIAFLISLFSGDDIVYYAAKNLSTVLSLPMFVIGLGALREMLHRMPTKRRVVFILFVLLIFLLSPIAGVYSVSAAGVFAVIFDRSLKKKNN